ncbi:MAG: hypothetical protein ACE5G2_02165, partial [Candidatus Krumholzibacteriia bacterium]
MGEPTDKPRVAILGAREDEVELLAELRRHERVDLVGVYDPDAHAPGLSLAEIAGVPAGSDAAARERLRGADCVVLPANRLALRDAVEWCSGLRSELVSLSEARRRWGSPTPVSHEVRPSPTETRLDELLAACTCLESPPDMGGFLLDTAMHEVGASGGSLQLLSPDTSALYLLAARGLSERVVRHARHALGEPISGLTAARR